MPPFTSKEEAEKYAEKYGGGSFTIRDKAPKSTRCEKHSRDGMNIPLLDRLATWLARPEVQAGVDALVIKARDDISGEIQEFDLLEQYLLSKKQVVTQDEIHRSVNTTAMYNAIDEAYTDLRAEINLIINGMH